MGSRALDTSCLTSCFSSHLIALLATLRIEFESGAYGSEAYAVGIPLGKNRGIRARSNGGLFAVFVLLSDPKVEV